MHDVPADLMHRLRRHGQEHVLYGWEWLSVPRRVELVGALSGVDLAHLDDLFRSREKTYQLPDRERIAPAPVADPEHIDAATRARGEDALRRGEVAVLLVAGGQGSRLGFDKPKGMFPVGPVTNKSLFHLHAEKVLALGRRYGKAPRLCVMTSDATDDDTRGFFDENRNFGLPRGGVSFFRQGTMPALDASTGKLLLEGPGKLFLSPNGHGGTLTALAESGLLDELKEDGVRYVFYFQVDNPLVKIADPAFLGYHIANHAEVSSRAVYKEQPGEKVGVLAQIDGRCSIIEYSDLPADMAGQRGADDKLLYRAGSPAIHVFDVEFLARITQGESRLPFHLARKKVPCIDAHGRPLTPEKENALKFEMFIFDALPMAERWTAVSTPRHEEFAPLKNATGADSPESVRKAISDLATGWLQRAGADVLGGPVEIHPLFALDADELAKKVAPGTTVEGPTHLN
jgi:UDP-N-acetylglucosamine/UDP-N-acetylgalactosamine diphosphorylase